MIKTFFTIGEAIIFAIMTYGKDYKTKCIISYNDDYTKYQVREII